jgi:hypothetical protein
LLLARQGLEIASITPAVGQNPTPMAGLLLLIPLLWWQMAVVKVIGTLRGALVEAVVRELAVAMAVLERGQLAVVAGLVVTLALVALVALVRQMAVLALEAPLVVEREDMEQVIQLALGVEALVVGVLAY